VVSCALCYAPSNVAQEFHPVLADAPTVAAAIGTNKYDLVSN